MRWAGLVLATGLALTSSAALGNGRFPRAQQLIEDPADPNHLILRATYGVLRSQDAGKSWFWICEKAIGYTGTEDPALGLMQSGRLLAGVFDGLASSPDTGCSWSFAGGELTERYVVDLTVERQNRSRALAMVSMGQGGGVFLNQLHRTVDDGASWSKLGADLPDDLLGLTLDPAPSDATRIYVTALEFGADGGPSQGVFLRSTDDGASFERLPIAGTSLQNSPFIAAVDAVNPDRVYVRVAGAVEDYLLVSDDAGSSFTEVLRGGAGAELYGFALSPDGSTVLAGFGDPRDGTQVDDAALGIWSASTSDFSFSRVYTEPVACLTWSPTKLYACTGQFDAGFELGASTDGGQTFQSVMALADLEGPVECPAGTTVGDVCQADWQATCELIGKCVAGTGGAAGAAGAGNTPPSEAESDDCGCRVPGGREPGWGLLLAALGALVAARRSRDRASRC